MPFYLTLESHSYCMKDNTIAILQIRNPNLAGLSGWPAFSSSECSSVTIETHFHPFPRSWFFNCLKMPPKWDEGKMKGNEKGKNGEDVFRVTEWEKKQIPVKGTAQRCLSICFSYHFRDQFTDLHKGGGRLIQSISSPLMSLACK